MSNLPSENTAGQNDDGAQKPAKQKREKKTVVRRRGRSITVSVTLSGEVAKWCKSEADENFRTVEGQIAYCVKGTMDGSK